MKAKSIAMKMILGVSGIVIAAGLALMPQAIHAQGPSNSPQFGSQFTGQLPGMGAEGAADTGYLGLSMREVNAGNAKELKLTAVRGALVAEVRDDSPAAKAGIRKGDVITEYNGQRVEGILQLSRLVRETPPGRVAQLSVWRDGRSQTLSAEVGQAPSPFGNFLAGVDPRTAPRDGAPRFGYRNAPPADGTFGRRNDGAPALGIDAQDLTGQMGSYFKVPNGEGVLVGGVHKDSPAEKAGIKTGDVITKVDGQSVRNVDELRDRMREKRDAHAESVTITLLRDGAERSVSVQPDGSRVPERRAGGRSTPVSSLGYSP
jgi:serine protease Do